MEPGRCAAVDAVGGEHGIAQPWKAGAADDRAEQQAAGTEHVAQRERRRLHVIGRFQIADRDAQVDTFGCQIDPNVAGIGHDCGQSIMPALVVAANDHCRVERGRHVRQPVETIVERTVMEESIAGEAGGALLPQGAGAVVD